MAKIKDLPVGKWIDHNGHRYVLLNPSTGYIVASTHAFDSSFDPNNTTAFDLNDSNNLAFKLNNTFLNSLEANLRNQIIMTEWNIGGVPLNYGGIADAESYEKSLKVTAKIGTLSVSDVRKYSPYYGGFWGSSGFSAWTLNPYPGAQGHLWYMKSGTNELDRIYANNTYVMAYPTFYVNTDLEVDENGFVFNVAPTNTTIPTQSTQLGANKIVNLASYFSDLDGDTLTFTTLSSNTVVGTVTVSGSTLTLRPITLGSTTITVTANDGKGGTKSTTFIFSVVNSVPTVTLTSPLANQTLYENDVFNIEGSASDADNGNSVTVRYQVNANTARAIKAFIANGSAEVFSKTLTFKSGSLYDGDTLIAGNLSDGVAHTLKVWATDDQGGTSVIAERTFYAVPNRAPSLSINPISTAGTIDNDKFTISGAFSDPDGNQATVRYRINGSNSVQVASGVSGVFDFDVSFGQLVIGTNNIVVEVQDSMGSKSSKTIKLTKNKVETPLLRSTERYKIVPPTGSTRGVLLWIHRDPNLDIDVSISMGMVGEAESYAPLTVVNSGPSPDFDDVVEDEFYIESDTAKDNIILQIDMTRSSVDVNDGIVLIQGVLE